MGWCLRVLAGLTLCLLAMTGAMAQGTAPATGAAKDPESLPPLDLLVYVDQSKTIYTGTGANAPNLRLAEMLGKMFDLKIDGGRRTFITTNDRVFLYSFGDKVAEVKQVEDAGDRTALKAAIQALNEVTPDTKTNFKALLDGINANGLLKEGDQRLKLILIASDFIDDPSDSASNADGTGVCDLLGRYQGNPPSTRIDSEIQALASTLGEEAVRSWPPFVGLLVVEPTAQDFAGVKSANYRNCLNQTVALGAVHKTMTQQLGATPIRYKDVANDTGRFASQFVEAALQSVKLGLSVEPNGSYCRVLGAEGSCAINLFNQSRLSNTLSALRFQLSEQAPEPLFTIPAALEMGAGRRIQQAVRLTANDVAKLPARIEALYVGTQDGGRIPQKPVKITFQRPLPIEVASAQANHSDSGDGGAEIALSLRNPNPSEVGVSELRFFSDDTATQPRARLPIAGARLSGDGGGAFLNRPLTPQLIQLLPNGLFVEAVDQNGLPSPRKPVAPLKEIKPLELQKAEIKSAGQGGVYRLEVSVRNPGPITRGVGFLTFSSANKGAWRQRKSITSPEAIPANGVATISLGLTLAEDQDIVTGREVAVSCLDTREQACREAIPVAVPQAESLFIGRSMTWAGSATAETLSLSFSVRNPGPVPVRLERVAVWRGGDRETLPLVEKPTVPAGGEIPLTVPFDGGPGFWQRFHPNNGSELRLICGDGVDCGGAAARVPDLPSNSLTIDGTRPQWNDKVSSPELTIPVSNTADYRNRSRAVLASASGPTGGPVFPVILKENMFIPSKGTLPVSLSFKDVPLDALTGATIQLCVIALYDPVVQDGGAQQCPPQGRWTDVRLPDRKPLTLSVDDKKDAFDRANGQVQLIAKNTNPVPSRLSGVVLAAADKDGAPFRVELRTPIIIAPNSTVGFTAPLDPDQLKLLDGALHAKAGPVDTSNANQSNESILGSGAQFTTESYKLKILKAVEEVRWEVFDALPFVRMRTHISAKIMETRSSPASQVAQALGFRLTGPGAAALPSTFREVTDIAFNNGEGFATVSWVLPVGYRIDGPINVEARHRSLESVFDQKLVENDSFGFIFDLTPFLLIVFLTCLVLAWTIWREIKMKRFNVIKKIESVSDFLIDYLSDYTNMATVSSALITFFTAIQMFTTKGFIAQAAVFLTIFALVAAVGISLGILHAYKLYRQLDHAVQSGNPSAPYTLLAVETERKAQRWFWILFAIVLISGIILSYLTIPLHKSPDVRLFDL
ncbi:hypothetical protein [Azospirillum sp.]|uniref:hypothetical protein n=1 Tax=Azospirillum sp. TaxID=34012 RepID=UPI0026305E4B|nr:hypothetical protein [Azospirillum sp.]